MRILCYGKSELRQKARCDFFVGAGCLADWTTGLQSALAMISSRRYDAIILSPSVPLSEHEYINIKIKRVNSSALVFTLTAGSLDEAIPAEQSDFAQQLPAILAELDGFRSSRIAG